MGQAITIGLDIAKSVFQVHGVDEGGTVVIRRQVRRAHSLRSPASCRPAGRHRSLATAHHWARELVELGHQVRLMPPCYVKP